MTSMRARGRLPADLPLRSLSRLPRMAPAQGVVLGLLVAGVAACADTEGSGTPKSPAGSRPQGSGAEDASGSKASTACGDKTCGDAETCSTCPTDCGKCPASKPSAPNFVMVVIDDMGWYGSPVPTSPDTRSTMPVMRMPNLARLASRGVTFSRAYAAAPMCVPSRVSIHTGMSPARSGMTIGETGKTNYPLPDGPRTAPDTRKYNAYLPMFSSLSDVTLERKEQTIAEVLAPLGYESAAVGKWHMNGGTPSDHGYSVHTGATTNVEGNQDADTKKGDPKRTFSTTRIACDFIKTRAAKKQKFFANVNYYAIHARSRALPATIARYEKALPGTSAPQRRTAEWMAMAEELDQGIGMLRTCLEDAGVANNTYFLVLSDNGYDHKEECEVTTGKACPTFGAKWTLWDRGLRIPFWVEGPGVQSGGGKTRFIPSFVNHIDILPTLYQLAGGTNLAADAPKAEGLSLVRLLTNQGGAQTFEKRPMFFHWPHYREGGSPSSVILQGGWKLTRFYEFPDLKLLVDVAHDPSELTNRASAQADRFDAMNASLSSYLRSAGARMPTVNPGWCFKNPTAARCKNPEYDWRDWDTYRPCRYLTSCRPRPVTPTL